MGMFLSNLPYLKAKREFLSKKDLVEERENTVIRPFFWDVARYLPSGEKDRTLTPTSFSRAYRSWRTLARKHQSGLCANYHMNVPINQIFLLVFTS